MAHICIYITRIETPADSDYVNVGGYCRLSGMAAENSNIDWNVDIPCNALAANANAAIRDAAITQAELQEYTVGALDKKTLYGGAVGL